MNRVQPRRKFVEVCIYEVKADKAEEFNQLIRRVARHHRNFPGVSDARYMKRTHRQRDFTSARRGEAPVRLSRPPRSLTYVLYWEMDSEVTHGKATKAGLEQFFSEFRRCLVSPPRILLGERIL